MWMVAMAALGAAMLAVGLLWGWTVWSDRSATPVDDLLPRLVPGEAADESAEVPAASPTHVVTQQAAGVAPGFDAPLISAAMPGETADQASTPVEQPVDVVVVDIVVHVAGAVEQPGVVELKPGARVFQAIGAAGGALAEADLDRINLAALLVDGERLWVPVVGEDQQPALVITDRPAAPFDIAPSDGVLAEMPAPSDSVLDLNRASQTQFETLPGIGPALAKAIVMTRAARGPFFSIDELVEVDGIGPAKLEQLRSLVVVRAPATGG